MMHLSLLPSFKEDGCTEDMNMVFWTTVDFKEVHYNRQSFVLWDVH